MPGLRERLIWDAGAGALHDGPRRYLMMRPDVLMGAIHRLDGAAQAAMLDALAASVCEHGADSLRAYAEQSSGDAGALMAATAQAAADLGWGHWTLQALRRDEREPQAGDLQERELHLTVRHSPFADGWRKAAGKQATRPVCPPIRGMFEALAAQVLKAPAHVTECECNAQGAASCIFVARARASP